MSVRQSASSIVELLKSTLPDLGDAGSCELIGRDERDLLGAHGAQQISSRAKFGEFGGSRSYVPLSILGGSRLGKLGELPLGGSSNVERDRCREVLAGAAQCG